MQRFLLVAAVIFGLPLGAAVLGITQGVGWWLAFFVFELVFAKTQMTTLRGAGALFYNRKGVRRLEAGDAADAVSAFSRALRFSNGSVAYVNNLALALVYTGDLDRSRKVIEPFVEGKELQEPMRGILMSTWALLLALLGEVDAARVADEASADKAAAPGADQESFSVASWVIAARERRWPFSKPQEIKGAWARHLYDVLEAYVAGQGYRGAALDRPLPLGLARALAFQWPEMKAFLGG